MAYIFVVDLAAATITATTIVDVGFLPLLMLPLTQNDYMSRCPLREIETSKTITIT